MIIFRGVISKCLAFFSLSCLLLLDVFCNFSASLIYSFSKLFFNFPASLVYSFLKCSAIFWPLSSTPFSTRFTSHTVITTFTIEVIAKLCNIPSEYPAFSLSPCRRASDSSLQVHIASPPPQPPVNLAPNLQHICKKHQVNQQPSNAQPPVHTRPAAPMSTVTILPVSNPIL